MMVRSTTSALAAGAALAALTLGGTSVAWAQTEQAVTCEDATAVAANAQVAVDAETGELANLRAALDLALGANEDEQENTAEQDQAIADAQAALEIGETELADAQTRLEAAVDARDAACAPAPPDEQPPGEEPAPDAPDNGDPANPDDTGNTGGSTDGGSFEFDAGDFGQTDADDVPVGAADTGGL